MRLGATHMHGKELTTTHLQYLHRQAVANGTADKCDDELIDDLEERNFKLASELGAAKRELSICRQRLTILHQAVRSLSLDVQNAMDTVVDRLMAVGETPWELPPSAVKDRSVD